MHKENEGPPSPPGETITPVSPTGIVNAYLLGTFKFLMFRYHDGIARFARSAVADGTAPSGPSVVAGMPSSCWASRVHGRADVASRNGESTFLQGVLGGRIGHAGCEDRLYTAGRLVPL